MFRMGLMAGLACIVASTAIDRVSHAQDWRGTPAPGSAPTSVVDVWQVFNQPAPCDEGCAAVAWPTPVLPDSAWPPAAVQPAAMPWPDTEVDEPAAAPEERHFLPTGMVPVFGPRTSERDRYSGFGEQLTSTSWLARPLSIGGFGGGLVGSPMIHDRLSQHATTFFGMHYAWDYDHRWGIDKSLGYQPMQLSSGQATHTGRAWYGLYRLVHYPWGDMRWRPYVVGGIGGAGLRFNDDRNSPVQREVFVANVGLGLKYMLVDRLAISAEISDLIMPANGELSTVNSLTFVSGLEYRFAVPKLRHFRLRKNAEIEPAL
jgi:hypothetical protein